MLRRKPRNFNEKFSVEDFFMIEGIRSAFMFKDGRTNESGNYEAFQLSTGGGTIFEPGGRYLCSGVTGMHQGREACFCLRAETTLYTYCKKIVLSAWERTEARYPDWLEHVWMEDDHICRKIRFTSPRRKEATEYCREAIRDMVADPGVTVGESVLIRPSDANGLLEGELVFKDCPAVVKPGCFRLDMVIHCDILDKKAVKGIGKKLKGPKGFIPKGDKYRFSIEEVSRHILEVEDRLMALLNGLDSIAPLCDLDEQFIEAVDLDDFDLADKLLAKGANVNAIDKWGSTALGNAMYNGYAVEIAHCWTELLLARGADPNLFGYDGNFPLHWAVSYGPETVALLLAHGADPNINEFIDEEPGVISSPLGHAWDELAVFSNRFTDRMDEVVRMLKEAGAVLSADDEQS